MKKNILVTGGAGYVGSHASKVLYKAGYNPITIDSLSTGWSDSVKFGPFEQVDLLDLKKLNEVFLKHKPSSIMHFAALSQVEESIIEPEKYWRNNLIGSLNLLETAVNHKCLDFVFSSTCAIYGDQDSVIINENTPQKPKNPYSSSKRAVEEMIHHYSISKGLKYVIFRYFNVAGADTDCEIGEFHNPETHLIPLVLDAVSGKRQHIKIFGTDYKTFDGTCIRDYVHVSDIAEAHLLGLKWLNRGEASRVYNLGTGHGFSVREVIKCVEKVTNENVSVLECNRRFGDCSQLVSSSSLANKELGWTPIRSNLDQIITDAWRWHQNGFYSK